MFRHSLHPDSVSQSARLSFHRWATPPRGHTVGFSRLPTAVRMSVALALLLNLILAPFSVQHALAAPVRQADLVPYTHPDGLFTIDRPAAFSEEDTAPADEVLMIFDWVEAGALMALFDEEDDSNALAFLFLDTGWPFADYYDWEGVVDDILYDIVGEDVIYLRVETDEETLYTRMVVRDQSGVVYSVAAYGEDALLGMVIGASTYDWDLLGDTINAAVDTFEWDAEAVAAYLGTELESGFSLLPTPTPSADRRATATPTPAAPAQDVQLELYTPEDGIFSMLAPPGYAEEGREQIDQWEVEEIFPGFRSAFITQLIDPDDDDNLIALFFLGAGAELDVTDPEIWADVVMMVSMAFLMQADQMTTVIDDPDALAYRVRAETAGVTFLLDVQGEEGLVVVTIAGGPEWAALEATMTAALDSLTWERAAIDLLLGAEPTEIVQATPTPSVGRRATPAPTPAATPEATPEPEAEPSPTPVAAVSPTSVPATPVPDDEGLPPLFEYFFGDAPTVPGFLDTYQRLEDPEGVFTAYLPARLQGEMSAEWEEDVYTVYHVHWAADAEYEETYSTVLLAVMGPVNQIMMAYGANDDDLPPTPSFTIPTLEEWQASLDVYEESLMLPDDAYFTRHAIPDDEYGVLFYAEATDSVADDLEDESYRMWTYMTQQDGIGFVVFLLGPLEESENIHLHADADVRFPRAIDLGLESVSWDLDAAKAAMLDHLAERYSPEEVAEFTSQGYTDPLGGFEFQVAPRYSNFVRTLEADAYSVGFRAPRTRDGIFLRFTDIGESLTPEEWLDVLDIVAEQFWPLVNEGDDDAPPPEVLAESVSSDDYNFAAYEIVGTSQHALFEFIEIDGLFAFAAALTELENWDEQEADLRYMMESIQFDSDVVLENLSELGNLPAALLSANVLEAPTAPRAEDEIDDESENNAAGEDEAEESGMSVETGSPADDAPFVLAVSIGDLLLPELVTLLVNDAQGNVIGQISGWVDEDVEPTQAFDIAFAADGTAEITFRFSPAAPWQPGRHTAELYVADAFFGEFSFVVTGPAGERGEHSLLRDVSLTVAGEPNPGDEAALHAYAPEDTLRYRFNLRAPNADHQVRAVVYQDGELVQELFHAWHLPHGARNWNGHVDLYPVDGWEPGAYTIHLWVNDSPWDVQAFDIVDPGTPLDATQDPEAFLDALPATVEILSVDFDDDGLGLAIMTGAPPGAETPEHEILLDSWDAWLRGQGYTRAAAGTDPELDGELPFGGKIRRYVQGETQILTIMEDTSAGMGFAWGVGIRILSPQDSEYLPGLNAVPLTPDTAAGLVPVAVLEPTDAPEYIDMVYVNGGRYLATLNLAEELVVYDTATWREVYRYGTGVFGFNLTTDPQGTRLAIAYQDARDDSITFPLVVWDTATWEVLTVFEGHAGAVTALAFDPSGDWLVSAGMDSTLRLWSLAGELPMAFLNASMEGGEYAVTALDISAGGDRVGMIYSDGVGELWRLSIFPGDSTLQPLYTFEPGGRDMHRLRMFPDFRQQDSTLAATFGAPQMLVVAGNEVQVWTYYDQVAEMTYAIPGFSIAAAFSPDAQVLVIGGGETFIVDTLDQEVLAELDYAPTQLVDVSPNGQVALLDGAGNLYVLAPAE